MPSPATTLPWATGDVLRLRHAPSGRSLLLLLEVEKQQASAGAPPPGGARAALILRVAPPEAPYDRLQVGQNAKLSWGGKAGRFCLFDLLVEGRAAAGSGGGVSGSGVGYLVRLRSAPNSRKPNRSGGSEGWHVGVAAAPLHPAAAAAATTAAAAAAVAGRGAPAHSRAWYAEQGRHGGLRGEGALVGDAAADASSLFVAERINATVAAAAAVGAQQAEGAGGSGAEENGGETAGGSGAGEKGAGAAAGARGRRRRRRLRTTTGLCDADIAAFAAHGFVVLRGAVPRHAVRAALGVINRQLGTPGAVIPGGLAAETTGGADSVSAGKLAGGVGADAALLGLCRRGTPAYEAADALLGGGCCAPPASAQIAMRFPEPDGGAGGYTSEGSSSSGEDGGAAGAVAAAGRVRADAGAAALPGTQWHVDGMRQGKAHPFSLLLGVALSDVRAPLAGNLCVFPGSHRRLQPLLLPDGRLRGYEDERFACAGKGKPQSPPGLLDLGAPLQLRLRAGDAVLMHPSLAHRGAPNLSPHIRYAAYFRLKHARHAALREADGGGGERSLWAELEGVQRWRHARAAQAEVALLALRAAHETSTRANAEALRRAPAAAAATTAAVGGADTAPFSLASAAPVLTAEQLETFRRDGVLVVPGLLSPAELAAARGGLEQTLREHAGVELSRLEETAAAMGSLSSVGGAGGVLDLFYPAWKLALTLAGERYAKAASQLFQATYATWDPVVGRAAAGDFGGGGGGGGGEEGGDCREGSALWRHEHGAFDSAQLFAHVDRLGCRLPDALSQAHGSAKRPMQRSLTPHLDCCPTAMRHGASGKAVSRWRPIQCLLSLTDALEPEHGGFEAAKGFHREFDAYYGAQEQQQQRQQQQAGGRVGREAGPREGVLLGGTAGGGRVGREAEPPRCVKDYCAVRPREDAAVVARIAHVPCAAGSAIFWDQRVPHANSRHHLGAAPRCVVYGGFLPRVAANLPYAEEQRRRFEARAVQADFWLEPPGGAQAASEGLSCEPQHGPPFVPGLLGEHLLGMDLPPRTGEGAE